MQTARIRAYFLLFLLIATALLVLSLLRPFLVTLALAVVFAVLLYPLYSFLLRHLGKRRSIAGLLTLLVAVLLVITPLTLLGARLLIESQQLYYSLVEDGNGAILERLATTAGQTLSPIIPNAPVYAQQLSGELHLYTQQVLSWLIQHLSSAFSGVLGLMLRLFIFLMALFYFLVEGTKIRKAVIRLSPLLDKDDENIFSSLERTINSVVKGTLIVAVVQGMMASLGYTLFGVPNPLLWGVTTSIAALVPGVGTSLVIFPCIVYLFITGHLFQAAGLLVWGLTAVGLIDNFLGPRLMGSGAQLHPLAILISVLGGISLMGPAGIFLGPLLLSLLLALFNVYLKGSEQPA